MKTKDHILLGDFNAKLRCKKFPGSHERGLRNTNREYLFELCVEANLVAVNTLFKHKAYNITTWEGSIKGRKAYNQIDYILVPHHRKHSIIDARSHQTFTVDCNQSRRTPTGRQIVRGTRHQDQQKKNQVTLF